MSLEPHAVTTVSRCPLTPPKEQGRTLADYRADLIRRFGKVPSWPELAKRENAARARVTASSPMSRPQVGADRTAAHEAARTAFAAKKAERQDAMLAYMTDDFRTSGDLATHFKISIDTVQGILREMKLNGLVTMTRIQRTAIWRAATVENPFHSQAVAITVRGQDFPSMAACARHFGISVEAVSCAAKRGTLDNIGTRRRKGAGQ